MSLYCWAEAPIKIARMTLTIKLDGNWSSFQLANSTPPLCVTDSAIAPSARMANTSGQAGAAKQVMMHMPVHVSFLMHMPAHVLHTCAASGACCMRRPSFQLPAALPFLRLLIDRPKPRSSWSGCHSSVMVLTPHRHVARVQVMPPVPRNPAPQEK